jgi:hypothetical protein
MLSQEIWLLLFPISNETSARFNLFKTFHRENNVLRNIVLFFCKPYLEHISLRVFFSKLRIVLNGSMAGAARLGVADIMDTHI